MNPEPIKTVRSSGFVVQGLKSMNPQPITPNPKRGFSLIPLILIIIVVGIIIGSTSTFIMQSVKFNLMNAQKTQALLAAQAGMMEAAYFTIKDGSYISKEANLVNNQWYLYNYLGGGGGGAGTAANWVYVDNSLSACESSNRQINKWAIKNLNPSTPYTIKTMDISWVTSGRNLTAIYLNDPTYASPNWGPASSATPVTIPDLSFGDEALPANSTIPPAGAGNVGNQLRYDGNVSTKTITAVIYFNDGSSITQQIFPTTPVNSQPTPPAGNPDIIISTGEVKSGSNVVMRQTIVASFDATSVPGSLKITKYDEF